MQGVGYYYRKRRGGSTTTGSGTGGGGGSGGPTLPQVSAIWSDPIVDSMGANLHIPFGGYIYSATPDATSGYASAAAAIRGTLDHVGIRHVRDNISVNSTAQRTALHTVCSGGIDVLFSCGDLAGGTLAQMATPTGIVSDVQNHYAGISVVLEGLNESNGKGKDANWAADTRTYQTNLWNAAHPAGLTVVSPPLADGSGVETTLAGSGGVNATSDVCALHIYQGSGQPSTNMSGKFANSSIIVDATKPRWITELGYHTAIHASVGYPPVPEDVQAVYSPILAVEAYRQGGRRNYLYELADDRRDDALSNWQKNFGQLARWGVSANPLWSLKPAADSLKNLVTLLKDPGDSYVPTAVPMTVTGGDSGLRFILTGKRDGTYALLMYRDVKVYNAVPNQVDAGSPITVSPQTITVTFDQSRTVKQYQPDNSASAASTTSATTHTVSLAGSLKILTF